MYQKAKVALGSKRLIENVQNIDIKIRMTNELLTYEVR